MNASTEQGFQVLELQSSRAALRLVPDLGGRIISLKSARTGREWCWHRPRPDWLWAGAPGSPFGEGPQAGVDECVPTVAPCRVAGRDLPDHGEVWNRAWTRDDTEPGALAFTVPLAVSPFVFTRAIRAQENGTFRFDYSLRNTGPAPEPFLWSLHPLLNLEPGDRLDLPGDVRTLRLNGGLGAPMALGDVVPWPEAFPGVRLDRCETPGIGGCVKGFAGPLETGRATVVNDRTGDRLELRWDPADLPYLGLWLNRGLGGFHHVALEPATGAPDALADALAWGSASLLPPGGTKQWALTLEIA